MVLALAIVVVNQLVFTWLFPPPPEQPKPVAKVAQGKSEKGKGEKSKAEQAKFKQAAEAKEKAPAEIRAAEAPREGGEKPEPKPEAIPAIGPQRGTLGSLNTGSPYRMLVS